MDFKALHRLPRNVLQSIVGRAVPLRPVLRGLRHFPRRFRPSKFFRRPPAPWLKDDNITPVFQDDPLLEAEFFDQRCRQADPPGIPDPRKRNLQCAMHVITVGTPCLPRQPLQPSIQRLPARRHTEKKQQSPEKSHPWVRQPFFICSKAMRRLIFPCEHSGP